MMGIATQHLSQCQGGVVELKCQHNMGTGKCPSCIGRELTLDSGAQNFSLDAVERLNDSCAC